MKTILLKPMIIGASNPGELFKKVMGDAKSWLLAGMGVYAAVQFILGCMDFMSKEPQKHSAGKDHMIHACVGLVGAFAASTVMTYLETQTGSWTAFGPQVHVQLMMLSEAARMS